MAARYRTRGRSLGPSTEPVTYTRQSHFQERHRPLRPIQRPPRRAVGLVASCARPPQLKSSKRNTHTQSDQQVVEISSPCPRRAQSAKWQAMTVLSFPEMNRGHRHLRRPPQRTGAALQGQRRLRNTLARQPYTDCTQATESKVHSRATTTKHSRLLWMTTPPIRRQSRRQPHFAPPIYTRGRSLSLVLTECRESQSMDECVAWNHTNRPWEARSTEVEAT